MWHGQGVSSLKWALIKTVTESYWWGVKKLNKMENKRIKTKETSSLMQSAWRKSWRDGPWGFSSFASGSSQLAPLIVLPLPRWCRMHLDVVPGYVFTYSPAKRGESWRQGWLGISWLSVVYTSCVFLHDLPMFKKGMAGEIVMVKMFDDDENLKKKITSRWNHHAKSGLHTVWSIRYNGQKM